MNDLKFFGQFDPPVDRFIWSRYFSGMDTKGIFVECGAFDGATECSCRFFEETLGWTGYNLEPVPHIYEKLTQNRPASRNLNVGLSDEDRQVSFSTVIHPTFGHDTTIGAIRHSSELRAALEGAGCTFEEIFISVISWNSFIAQENIRQIDLMVLDVEGHELSVLSGMKGSPVLPKIMCIEFGHAGFDGVRAQMDELGYEYDVNSNANAYFVRRDVLGLFAFRQTASNNDFEMKLELLRSTIEDQRSRVTFLEQRESELLHAYQSIVNSRGWRLLEKIRQIIRRNQ